MNHLRDLSTVLADDESGTWVDVPVDVRLRALAHVADCPSCRADVEEQRRVKARMRLAAGAPTLQAMPAGLLDSLLRLPASPQQPARSSSPAPLVTSANTRRPPPRAASGVPRGVAGQLARGRYVAAAGIAASVVVGLGGGGSVLAGAAGGGAAPGPAGASPSAPTVGATGLVGTSGTGFAQTVAGFATTAPTNRPFAASALSVVYRRP